MVRTRPSVACFVTPDRDPIAGLGLGFHYPFVLASIRWCAARSDACLLFVCFPAQLAGTQYSSSLDLLRLFAYGTLKDYKSKIVACTFAILTLLPFADNSGSLPALLPDQVRKLKQLSVLTLAESTKILPYDQLMQELDVSNVRELEDFLINECMYSGIVRGKLDQLRRCFEVQFAAGRDLTPDQLNNMIEILSDWLGTSDSLLHQIQEKIKWADTMSDVNKKHQKEFEDRVEEAKKSIKVSFKLKHLLGINLHLLV
ncbi:COP9 signalosome complex subunit 7 [Zea mays]|uniref:COP9 signalosome complex subunit 7 n=1 Tax=Zea mays TaxID=4577 RepID=A0A3L6D6X1_MAIZE|nr:COP9 signalosome complex subunit 7 [Zea mays]